MSKWIFAFYLLFVIIPTSVGQRRSTPSFTKKNYFSYQFGLAYPFLSKGNFFDEGTSSKTHYTILHSGINYGIHAGGGYAHFFSKKFYFKLDPALIFTKVSSGDYQYVLYKSGGLEEEHNGTFQYSHFSLFIPIDFSMQVSRNIDFTSGVFWLKPFWDRESSVYDATLYYRNPVKTLHNNSYHYKNFRVFARVGIHFGISILMKEKDWKQVRINLDYNQSLTSSNFYHFENWISLSMQKAFFH